MNDRQQSAAARLGQRLPLLMTLAVLFAALLALAQLGGPVVVAACSVAAVATWSAVYWLVVRPMRRAMEISRTLDPHAWPSYCIHPECARPTRIDALFCDLHRPAAYVAQAPADPGDDDPDDDETED